MKIQSIPQSVTNSWLTLVGLICFLGVASVLKYFGYQDMVTGACLCLFATSFVIAVLDLGILKVHRRESTGLDWSRSAGSLHRSFVKWLGLIASILFVGILYWLFQEYQGGFYDSYKALIKMLLPFWLVLAFPYFYWIDSKQRKPEDSYYQMGLILLLQFEKVDRKVIVQHLLGWLVKGFFLPLMFTYFVRDLSKFINFDLSSLDSFKTYFDFLYDLIFLIDVGIVSMGYLMSFKLTDTHLRSTEPTTLGWLVALICYQPYWSLIGKQYIDYSSGQSWGSWLSESPVLYTIWGSMILGLFGIYVWSSVTFGMRFSNLTHRGILTNGPYRFTRHPAYVSKNIAWWLVSVPFAMEGSFLDVLRKCLLVGMINWVYYLRAKTEEKHLSVDPVYVAYAEWIDENGIFRHLPWGRFKK